MTRKLTTIAIFTTIMVTGGYVFYLIANLLPVPGSKFIVMGPYLTCVMILPLIRYPRFGTLSLINFVFGGVMFILSPWMTLAIIISGIAADLVMLLPVWTKVKQVLAMGVYNTASLLTSAYVTNYITGNVLYKILNFETLLLTSAIAFIAGALGGYAGLRVNKLYLKA
jgi:hypothetical protein